VAEAHAGPLQTSALPLGYGAVSLKLASYLDFLNPPSQVLRQERPRLQARVVPHLVVDPRGDELELPPTGETACPRVADWSSAGSRADVGEKPLAVLRHLPDRRGWRRSVVVTCSPHNHLDKHGREGEPLCRKPID